MSASLLETEALCRPSRICGKKVSTPRTGLGMASDKPNCDDKKDPIKLDSEESPIGSSVDGESGEPGDGEGEGDGAGLANPPEQAPKRKGGRKPVRDKRFSYYQRLFEWATRRHACMYPSAERRPGTAAYSGDWNVVSFV